jgi:hypothetical protein
VSICEQEEITLQTVIRLQAIASVAFRYLQFPLHRSEFDTSLNIQRSQGAMHRQNS